MDSYSSGTVFVFLMRVLHSICETEFTKALAISEGPSFVQFDESGTCSGSGDNQHDALAHYAGLHRV